MSNNKTPHYTSNSIPHNKGILQKSYNYEQHETPEHKIKWDEEKLRLTEKQKENVTMKIDEPNTPFIRYDPLTDTVTNLQDLPNNIKRGAYEEPDDFSLDDNEENALNINKRNSLDEWDKLESKEEQEQEEAAKRKHVEFERKRAQHYFREGKRI